LAVLDLERSRELCNLRGHKDQVYGLAIWPDGRRAISASKDGTLRTWDLDSCREIQVLKGHSSWVQTVTLNGDGTRAASASWGTIIVRDLASDDILETASRKGTFTNITSCAFCDSETFIAGDEGGLLWLFKMDR